MNPENPNRHHYPALDGLRGAAILLIVFYHNFESVNVPGSRGLEFLGWISVDLFFVLSGFLITEILLKTVGKKGFLGNFYIRRVLRIFPLYYLALILFLLIIPKFNLQFDIKYYINNQIWLWTYLQNWLFVLKPQDHTNALNHFWTLSVEEQFYLLWPLAVLFFRKPKYLLIFILSLFILMPALRLWIWTRQIPHLAYFNLFTFTRIDGICMGCIVALLQRIDKNFLKKKSLAIIAFITIVDLGFLFFNQNCHLGLPDMAIVGYPTVAIMFGLLVNEGIRGKSKLINLLFTIPLLKFFGKISYGLYIFHWPVYFILYPYLTSGVKWISSGWVSELVISGVATTTAIIISWLSYNFYEKYFLKLKGKFV